MNKRFLSRPVFLRYKIIKTLRWGEKISGFKRIETKLYLCTPIIALPAAYSNVDISFICPNNTDCSARA